jgi:hypothetical protein
VDTNEFDQRLARLIEALEETASLLRRRGSSEWAASLDSSRLRIVNHDRDGFDQLLGVFGGMGSLNDLVFHPLNGNASGNNPADWDNETLDGLRHRLFTEATALRNELDRP